MLSLEFADCMLYVIETSEIKMYSIYQVNGK
jgi:hypothetical protein